MSDSIHIRSRIRDYEVHFTDDIGVWLASSAEDRFFIIDERVMELHADWLEPSVPTSKRLLTPADEEHKTVDHCKRVVEELAQGNVRRGDTLVAVGGGVVQDVTAFTASIYLRGIDWEFYPTTLLAQADSCMGGKTSINVGSYKNIVGNFYPPRKIIIDTEFLTSLPEREVKSGIGEILHYYLVDDAPQVHDLMERYDSYIQRPADLGAHIRTSLEIKKAMVEIDEFDQAERRVFNYGHTFGHAIEAVSAFRVNHGQAVTLGMDLANFVSRELGMIDDAVYRSMSVILERNMPAYELPRDRFDDYMRALARDKKNIGDRLGCILTRGPGRMEQVHIPMDTSLEDLIASYFHLLELRQAGLASS